MYYSVNILELQRFARNHLAYSATRCKNHVRTRL